MNNFLFSCILSGQLPYQIRRQKIISAVGSRRHSFKRTESVPAPILIKLWIHWKWSIQVEPILVSSHPWRTASLECG